MYRALAILMAIIQFSFAFHALKTGRGAKWIMIIILAPVVGCLAYFEAKYRYAALLKRLGRAAEANELFEFIVAKLESEQEWVRLAKVDREREVATV